MYTKNETPFERHLNRLYISNFSFKLLGTLLQKLRKEEYIDSIV